MRGPMLGTIVSPGHPLNGARVKYLRRSPKTGHLTCTLLEPWTLYSAGTTVVVKAGALRLDPHVPTPSQEAPHGA